MHPSRTVLLGLSAALCLTAIACGSSDAESNRLPPGGGGAGGGELPDAAPGAVAACEDRFAEDASCAASSGRTFFVSSSQGSDTNDGLAADTPLATVAAVNALELEPGDRVLFRCGDTWAGEDLAITRSGSECQHIVFSSYPEDAPCDEPPTLRGSLPVTGFVEEDTNVWVADLDEGQNAGHFANGLTQVFSGDSRLPIGRWPNADEGDNAGWSYIDSGGGSTISDSALPAVDWTGAILRVKTIRWLLLSRRVTGASAGSLTLNDPIDCWDGCGDPDGSGPAHGWGYQLVNHRATLDRPGEWFHDDAQNRLYVVSSSEPTTIEASPVPGDLDDPNDPRYRAGIVLGTDLGDPISYVVVENLRVQNHFNIGIASPVNFHLTDNHDLVLRCNTITNPESLGIGLMTWVYDSTIGPDDWYGGTNIVVANNVIEGPNSFGIRTRSVASTFQENVIRDVGQLRNLGEAGLGCGLEGSNCTEHGDGILMQSVSQSVFRRNHVQRTGYCGFDVFGDNVLLEENVIDEACSTKGDCGAIRLFGSDSFDGTTTHDITLRRNIVRDVVGPTNGDSTAFEQVFGFGLYIDHYSDAVVADGNVVMNATAAGILVQDSRASVSGNTVFGCASAVSLAGSSTVSALDDNVLVSTDADSPLLVGERDVLIGAERNVYFSPYMERPIRLDGDQTLAEWQAGSGLDGTSTGAWYTLNPGAPANFECLVNDTAVAVTNALDGPHADARQAPLSGSVEVPPYSAVVVVAE